MARFWVESRENQDLADPCAVPPPLSPVKANSSSNLTAGGSVEAATNTTAGDVSSQEEEYYEEEVVPLTIKTTSRQESLTDFSEGTEITMSLPRRLDKYGFIINVNSKGDVIEGSPSAAGIPPTATADSKRSQRREQKWNAALNAWDKQRPTKIKQRLRKGVPDALRGRVWMQLGGGIRQPGLYQEIVQKTSDAMLENYKELASQSIATQDATTSSVDSEASSPASVASSNRSSSPTKEIETPEEPQAAKVVTPRNGSSASSSSSPSTPTRVDYASSKNFRAVQDTIERDIHRTFPRHNLFYEEDHDKDDEAVINEASSLLGFGVGFCDFELASMIVNLETDIKLANSNELTQPLSKREAPDGQAALRRVLRAYSYYDREIGYCQGMNFIAGMFLTLMSEEEAFWLLVGVMHQKPCEMRGMFGEGMRETHKVLHVAERLIHHHLPKLARHFDRENIHVTMYATQWLLTQYTSSFKFDLVTRVWDCFLGEGWKIIYRVMLALLQQWQSKLLKMSFEEILSFFRDLSERVDGHSVLDAALRIPLKTRHIARYEEEWYSKQQQQSQR